MFLQLGTYYGYYYQYYYYNDQVYFNQSEYNFTAGVDTPPGTKLGTAWISMPLSLASLENGNLAPLQIFSVYASYNGLYFSSHSTPWSAYVGNFIINLHLNDQEVIPQGYEKNISLSLTEHNVNFCGDEHILIPIDIYTQSDFFAIGTYRFYIDFSLYINGAYFYFNTRLLVDVDSGKYMYNKVFLYC